MPPKRSRDIAAVAAEDGGAAAKKVARYRRAGLNTFSVTPIQDVPPPPLAVVPKGSSTLMLVLGAETPASSSSSSFSSDPLTKGSSTPTSAPAPTTVTKKKPGNRKTKRDWRKNVDMEEVEDYLEEKRKDELLGGSLSEQPDKSLFVIDKSGKMNAEQKRQKKLTKIDMILQPNKNVKPVFGRQVPKKKFIPADAAKIERLANHLKENLEQMKNTESAETWPELNPEITEKIKEQWEGAKSDIKPSKVKKPEAAEAVPAIPLIHPGSSYNPDPKQHEELIKKAAEEELGLMKKEEKEKKQKISLVRMKRTDGKMDTIDPLVKINGLNNEGNDNNNNDGEKEEEGGNEEELIPPKKKPATADNRKTKAQRRKKLKNLRAEKRIQKKKAVKKFLNDIDRVKSLVKEINKEGEKNIEIQKQREQKKVEAKLMPQRLGAKKFAPPSMLVDVKLPSALPSSFRTLQSEGNLFRERYLNMQQRNIIEPRDKVPQHQRRYQKIIYNKKFRDLDPDFL